MGFDNVNWMWFRGALIPWTDAKVHVATHALHYGTGVFEGIRCYDGPEGPVIFRLDDHLDRLMKSAALYGFEHGQSVEDFTRATREVITANGFRTCYIRPIIWSGMDHLGIRAECPIESAVLAWPEMGHTDAATKVRGIRVTLSPHLKIHSSMLPSTAKACGQYMSSRLAVREALARGFDAPVLCNADGTIAEGAVENLFVVRDGQLVTNDEHSNILLGITRAAVLDLARDLGIDAVVRAMTPDDLRTADEAFFTGTAAEITTIRELDGLPVGDGRRGPITQRLHDAYVAAATGTAPGHPEWRTPVSLKSDAARP